MISKFYNYGITNNYFEERKISQFHNAQREGLSSIQTIAIEFDKTAKKIARENRWNPCKSCDALKFLLTNNRFDLLEFKQVKIRNESDLKELIEKFDLNTKIKDSFFLLKCIRQKINLSNQEKTDYNLIEKNVFFYMDPIEDSRLSLSFAFFWKTVDETINTLLEGIENIESNFNKPELKKLSELDNHY
jgi:hypothetical protein